MVPWVECPTLDLDLSRSLAEQTIPPEAVKAARNLLAAIKAMIPPAARMLAPLARVRTWNRFHAEVVAMSRLAGADWRDIMLANLSYDLVLASFGCSTIALPTRDGPVLARNMDWWPEDLLARASYLIRYSRAGSLCFASAGWPGSVGIVSGMSARGFAVVLNAVSCDEPWAKTGYPVLLHLRRVVEDAADFSSALDMLAHQRLTTSALFTLVGRDNDQRMVIERTPTRHALRRPAHEQEPLFATNDYRLLFRPEVRSGPEIYQTTCHRYEALEQFFSGWSATRLATDAELLYVLSDANVIQGITSQHILMRPRSQEIQMFVPRRVL